MACEPLRVEYIDISLWVDLKTFLLVAFRHLWWSLFERKRVWIRDWIWSDLGWHLVWIFRSHDVGSLYIFMSWSSMEYSTSIGNTLDGYKAFTVMLVWIAGDDLASLDQLLWIMYSIERLSVIPASTTFPVFRWETSEGRWCDEYALYNIETFEAVVVRIVAEWT